MGAVLAPHSPHMTPAAWEWAEGAGGVGGLPGTETSPLLRRLVPNSQLRMSGGCDGAAAVPTAEGQWAAARTRPQGFGGDSRS